MKNWTHSAFRRFGVDIHVPDWSPDLLGKFSAAEYVGNIAKGGLVRIPAVEGRTVKVIEQVPEGKTSPLNEPIPAFHSASNPFHLWPWLLWPTPKPSPPMSDAAYATWKWITRGSIQLPAADN